MRKIRLKLDKKYCKKCNAVDSLTNQTPATWRANATDIEVGAFENDLPIDLTGYTNLELVIRPDRVTSTNLAYQLSATPDSTTILAADWTAGTAQHVTFSLTDAELNFDLNSKERETYWLAVTASDPSGNETTLGTSWLIIEEDNNATADPPPEYPGAGIGENIIDAKGDLIVGLADDTPDRLAVGTDGQILIADSAETSGVKWGAASGTGDMLAATYDPTAVAGDVFDMDNMVETATNKILTAAERAEIAANTAASHAAVTVSDSAEIDFTLTGQDITASLIASSIDETKLDASVNASLDLGDSASQPGHTHVASDVTDFDTEVSNNTDVAANTADRHDAVSIAASGGRDYVTISGTQQLTLHTVDLTADVSGDLPVADGGTGASDAVTARTNLGVQSVIGFALSDETSALTTGQKIATDMPVSMNVKRVYASVGTAGGTSAITLYVENEGVTILNAVVSISAGANNAETSTFTGAASSYQLTKGNALTIDVDSIDDGTANSLKVYLIGDITA